MYRFPLVGDGVVHSPVRLIGHRHIKTHDTLDRVGILALNRALRVDGRQVAEAVCRTCLPKLGALLTRCRDSELGKWFDVGEPRRGDRPWFVC